MNETEKLQQEMGVVLEKGQIPRHIAIIMDGNGRWATRQGLSRALGHMEGYKVVHDIVRACDDLGVEALTLYSFSTENWTRPREEVQTIMELFEYAVVSDLPDLQENNVRLIVSGRVKELSESLQGAFRTSIEATAHNTGLVLNLAINYGGRTEILDAVRKIARRASEGTVTVDEITEEYFSGLMYTAGLPDPDLLIRTAGELRVSNFLLWQIAYTEIWVTSTLWPDFRRTDLMQAIADYQRRVRRFGAVVDGDSQG